MTEIDPKKLLIELKDKATSRKSKSLDLIYHLLELQTQNKQMDFSIATIGRLSVKNGGPSPQAIRNKGGENYRTLIEAWAASQGTTTKKPPSIGARNITPKRDEDILMLIEDPALKAVIGAIIRERNQFRNELRVLKSHTSITVDRRPIRRESKQPIELLPAITGLLTLSERVALEDSISEKTFAERCWVCMPNGRVKDENGRHLYKPGYISAIENILRETQNGE